MPLTNITFLTVHDWKMYLIVIYFLSDAKIPYLLSQNPVFVPFAFVL